MTFPLMEVWARYGSRTGVVMIHCVWQWPAKHFREHSTLSRVWKNEETFSKCRCWNLAFQANGTASTKA